MIVSQIDPRTLAVAIVLPARNLYYNWTTYAWEYPLVAASHLRTMNPVDPAPGTPFNTMLWTDIGNILYERLDAQVTFFVMDSTGGPPYLTGIYEPPIPTPWQPIGGFAR